MLILLRSDFRLPAREAFLKLMRHAHFKTDNVFDVPVLEAPQAPALILRVRNLQRERNMQNELRSILMLGTTKHETLEESVRVFDAVRKSVPYLQIFPHILLARRTEWRGYAQVSHASPSDECFLMPEAKLLVIEQRESYSERTLRYVIAHTMPPLLPKSEGKVREGEQTTTEFMLGDRPSATHQRITDEMLALAGVPLDASIEADSRDRATGIPPPPVAEDDPDKT